MGKKLPEKDSAVERIEEVRVDSGKNKTQFSNLLGMKSSHYSEILSGDRRINRNHLKILAENFNVNLNWLLTGQGEPFAEPVRSGSVYKRPGKEDMILNEETPEYAEPSSIKKHAALFSGLVNLKELIESNPALAEYLDSLPPGMTISGAIDELERKLNKKDNPFSVIIIPETERATDNNKNGDPE